MSNATPLIGFIQEFYPNREDREFYRSANDRALDALPVDDTWPPLCRSMVAVTGPDSEHGSFRGKRIFYLGGHFNHFVDDVRIWLDKFEALLRQLYWWHAELHVDGGWLGPSFKAVYSVSHETVLRYHDSPESPNHEWTLEVYESYDTPGTDDRLSDVLGFDRYYPIWLRNQKTPRTPPSVEIRSATIADSSAVADLLKAIAGVWQPDWRADSVDRSIAAADGLAFVAVAPEDRLIGLLCGHDLGFRAYLSEFAVAESQQCTGVGTALLQAFESALAGRGCRLVVADVYPPAEPFYRARGWGAPAAILLSHRLPTT